MKIEKLAPWLAGALALGAAAFAALPPHPVRGFDLSAFARLPVLEGGRLKPVDSIARNSLLVIRSQQSFRYRDRTVSADEWLLDVLFRPAVADDQPVFNVDNPEVLGLMALRQTRERYFSFRTLAPHGPEIERQALAAQQVDAKQRTPFQNAVLTLFERVFLYSRLQNTIQVAGGEGLAAELSSHAPPGQTERARFLAEQAVFRALPPAPGAAADAWRTVGSALASVGAADPALAGWARLGAAWTAQDASAFGRAAGDLQQIAASSQPAAAAEAGHELVFNRAQPFYAGIVIYILALLALFASWTWRPRLLQPIAFGLLVAGAIVHTAGLASRVMLQGRPPVTNLYSSAVFVGWVAVVLGIVIERIYRKGLGTVVAAACGIATLIVAHHLTGDGDTMEMMRAVLDSNFWLSTHVITITIGYAGTFFAGALAIGYTIRKHLVRSQNPATTRSLVSMTYGVIAFALFFSFVGTVLGGIWADQSWGRFWGWDPKENGALLIVLWNAIILHARWGGYARDRGVMAMAIFGNVITSLSWFGVNMLGVGLHSYGFMDKAFWALAVFIASQLLVMTFTLLPQGFWRAAPAAPKAGAPAGDAPKPV